MLLRHNSSKLTLESYDEIVCNNSIAEGERFNSIVGVYICVLMVTIKGTGRKTVILCSLGEIRFTSLGVMIQRHFYYSFVSLHSVIEMLYVGLP